jgi:hypothetical protein
MKTIVPSRSYGVWVGFNDLNPFIHSSSTVVCTGSPHWTKPPRLGETADVIAFDLEQQRGFIFGQTLAINYPIGARPQAVSSNGVAHSLVNNILNGVACLDIYDHRFTLIDRIVGLHHWCTTANMTYSYCSDFEISHRLGGYGYIFGHHGRSNPPYTFPNSISRYCHLTRDHTQILSLSDVASEVSCYLNVDQRDLAHSYLTHLLLSPDEKKLAFLFRSWLRDGGILTVLCTLDLVNNLDTRQISIELVGQLSHFTWVSTNQLMIYAYQILNKNSLRIRLNSYSAFLPLSKMAKSLRQTLTRIRNPLHFNRKSTHESKALELISNRSLLPSFVLTASPSYIPVSFPLPPHDGHPSFARLDNVSYLISDTYPDSLGVRRLFVINVYSETVHFISSVSEYRESFVPIHKWAGTQIQLPPYAHFTKADQSFTRSGLHCDCHPFLNGDSTMFGYHTSEDGYRTVKLQRLFQS